MWRESNGNNNNNNNKNNANISNKHKCVQNEWIIAQENYSSVTIFAIYLYC